MEQDLQVIGPSKRDSDWSSIVLPSVSNEISLCATSHRLLAETNGHSSQLDIVVSALRDKTLSIADTPLKFRPVSSLKPEHPTLIISHPFFCRSENLENTDGFSFRESYKRSNPHLSIVIEEIERHRDMTGRQRTPRTTFLPYALSLDPSMMENEMRDEGAISWAVASNYQIILALPVEASPSQPSNLQFYQAGGDCDYLPHLKSVLGEISIAIQPTAIRRGKVPGLNLRKLEDHSNAILLELLGIGNFYHDATNLTLSGGYLFSPDNRDFECLSEIFHQTLALSASRECKKTGIEPTRVSMRSDFIHTRGRDFKFNISEESYRSVARAYLELDLFHITSKEAQERRMYIRKVLHPYVRLSADRELILDRLRFVPYIADLDRNFDLEVVC